LAQFTLRQQAAGAELDHDISTWELRSEEIAFGTNKLGEGSFGSVTEGKLRGKSVAIKTMYTLPLLPPSLPSFKLTSSFATARRSMTQMRSTQFWMISEMSALL
jgi:hypothetical protein